MLIAVLFIPVVVASAIKSKKQCWVHTNAEVPVITGYSGCWYDNDIMQYKSSSSLVYIKKLKGVLNGEHNPVMCWLGAGYEFKSIAEEKVGNQNIYLGELIKDKEVLYTAWWYDNGTDITTSQMEWRWRVLNGAKLYSIINATASSNSILLKEVNKIIHNRKFLKAQQLEMQ